MSYDVQKAGMWKRISAYLFDFILLCILTVGLATLLSWALKYDDYFNVINECEAQYEAEYGVDFSLTQAEREALAEDAKVVFEDAYTKLTNDPAYLYASQMAFNLSFIIIIFSVLIAHLILEFAVPMIFKNGQTIGKKTFGVAVMRVDGVKIDGPLLFTRAILGKYVVETMLPILFVLMILFGIVYAPVGLIAIGAIVITNIVLVIAKKNNSAIHDILASTVVVDMASQLIFDSPEALLEYKQKIHAEAADNAEYF